MNCRALLSILGIALSGANAQSAASASSRYILRGTIRDSATGRPVVGAYVWPILTAQGAVTDSLGRYEIGWPSSALHTFLVRHCTNRNLAQIRVDFRDTVVVERATVITSDAVPCPIGTRAPWSVDASDTASFTGHYIYSWEGGGWLADCDGRRTYAVHWESPLGVALSGYQKREGQQTYVRFVGRVADDQVPRIHPGPLFLVQRLQEVRRPDAKDCR